MNKTADKKRPPLSTLYRLSPAGHIIAAVSAALILLHLLTRDDHALMVWTSERLVRPVHRALAVLNDHLPLSVAELLIGLAVIAVLIYIIYTIIKLFHADIIVFQAAACHKIVAVIIYSPEHAEARIHRKPRRKQIYHRRVQPLQPPAAAWNSLRP